MHFKTSEQIKREKEQADHLAKQEERKKAAREEAARKKYARLAAAHAKREAKRKPKLQVSSTVIETPAFTEATTKKANAKQWWDPITKSWVKADE